MAAPSWTDLPIPNETADLDDGDEFEANPAFAALKLHVWRSVKEEVDASRT